MIIVILQFFLCQRLFLVIFNLGLVFLVYNAILSFICLDILLNFKILLLFKKYLIFKEFYLLGESIEFLFQQCNLLFIIKTHAIILLAIFCFYFLKFALVLYLSIGLTYLLQWNLLYLLYFLNFLYRNY
jgi:hypothetical protein